MINITLLPVLIINRRLHHHDTRSFVLITLISFCFSFINKNANPEDRSSTFVTLMVDLYLSSPAIIPNIQVCTNLSIFFLDDIVHMNDEEQLEEYVLNDNGKVWQGTYKEPKGYQWFFGQFEAVVLPSIMMLLDRSSIPHQDRADPVKMARSISAIVSCSFLHTYHNYFVLS